MRKLRRSLATVLGMALGFGVGAVVAPTATAAAVNPAPAVQPGIQQWAGGTGSFTLSTTTRIVVDPSYSADLAADARTFAADLAALTGARFPVAEAAAGRAGDIFLTKGAATSEPSGYQLRVGSSVTVTGHDADGVFYGEQTVEQMLKLSPTRDTLPQGSATDWPLERLRSEQIDVARHFQSVADLEQQIRIAAWMKLDSLHLHLADDEAFRMQSTTFPGLANVQSYSHADISAIVEYAHRYHVDVIPEIDIPGHSEVFTHYDPNLAFACPTLGLHGTAAYAGNGSTMDATNPAVLDFATKLIDEYAPLFRYSKYFHLGGDETPSSGDLMKCPEVAAYVQDHGYKAATDIFTALQNKLAAVVTGLGKTPIIWNWNSDADLPVDPGVVIDAWTGGASGYIDQGHQVIDTQYSDTYVVPDAVPGDTSDWIVNDGYYYGWTPSTASGYLGLEVTNWGDRASPAFPDSFYRSFSTRPAQVFAAVGWGGPRAADFAAFESQVDTIGAPPGLPEAVPPGARALTGAAYGSDASPTAPASNAFDGSATTSVDIAPDATGAAYAGLDLGAGNASPVTAVRYLPAMSSLTAGNGGSELAAQKTMVGGRFQGCTTGPAGGCTTIATIAYRPAADWQVLSVSDATAYRWLRYVPAPGQAARAGEIQFLKAPAAALPISVNAPRTMTFSGANTVTATVKNTGTTAIRTLRAALQANSADDATALTAVPSAGNPRSVAAGATASLSWRVTLPLGAPVGDYRIVVTAGTAVGSANGFLQGSASAVTRVAEPAVVASIPPVQLSGQGGATVRMTLTNSHREKVRVAWSMPVPDYSPVATFGSGSTTVPAGGSTTVSLALNQPRTGQAQIPLTVTDASGEMSQRWDVDASLVSSFPSAYNSVGITSDSDRTPAGVGPGLDGEGSTLSSNTLAAAGVSPGSTVNAAGFAFTWPDAADATPDNVAAGGQAVTVDSSGSRLGLLGLAGGGGVTDAAGTVHYTDGTSQAFTVSDADWHTAPATGPQPVLTLPYVNYANQQWDKTAYLYVNSAPLDPTKNVAWVALPTAGNLHVFAIAVS